MFSRAKGGANIDQPMRCYFDFPQLCLEIIDEFVQCLDLFGGGIAFFKTSNQTDAQRDLVLGIAPQVSSGILIRPTWTNLNFAIAAAIAIADHKMISQSVLHVFDVSMVIIKRPGAAEFCGTAVEHNHLPSRSCDLGSIYFGSDAAVEKPPVGF